MYDEYSHLDDNDQFDNSAAWERLTSRPASPVWARPEQTYGEFLLEQGITHTEYIESVRKATRAK